MKKVMKLFPAALAVLALASCSDNDLLFEDSVKAQREAGKLYVQVEGLQDGMDDASTRAGFVNSNVLETSGEWYFVWTKNDQVKVYDDNNNWRPQIWKFDEAATKAYKGADGFSVFDKVVAISGITAPTSVEDQYTNAYGVYPANLGKFTNENRSELEFDLSCLAKYNLDRTLVTDADDGNGYLAKAPIPLWGVATSADGSSEMKVKYLTGILKVDIAQLPATTGSNHNYLVINSMTKAPGGGLDTKAIDLHPSSVTAGFNPEDVKTAPALQVASSSSLGTFWFAAPTPGSTTVSTTTVPSDIIIIDLGENKTDLVDQRCCIVVPIVESAAGKQYISAYLALDDANAGNQITLDKRIGDTIDKNVKSSRNYLIQDELNYEIDANTPYNLAEQIKTLDAAADRTVNIVVKSNITVDDSNTDEHGYVVDLSDYELRNNVNVSFKMFYGAFVGKTSAANTLEIRTKANTKGKKLTITVSEGGNKLKAIKVTDKLAGALELQGTITAVEAGSKNLTINATVTTVNANAETNINASGKTITTLNINKGCEKVNLLNGTVTNAVFGAYSSTPADNKQIDANVEIHTEGNGQIGTINYANVPSSATNYFSNQVSWTSKWDGTSKNVATVISGVKDVSSVIVSASQLAKVENYTSDARILAKEIDLDGKAWTSLSGLTKSIDGNISVVPSSSTKTTAVVNTSIKKLQGTNGLIANWAPASNAVIKNITFDGGNDVKGNIGDSNIGLLVGVVDNQTAAGTIRDIEVKGTNTISGQGNGQGISAVIGQIKDAATPSNALTLANIKVNAGTTVNGFKNVGGIVGQIGDASYGAKVIFAAMNNGTIKSTSSAVVKGDDVFNTSNATLTTYRITTSSPVTPNLATKGQLFGGATKVKTAGDITIIGRLTKSQSHEDQWGYYLPDTNYEYFPWDIYNNYAEIGHCGFTAGANAVTATTGFNAINMMVSNDATTNPTYSTTIKLVPHVGKTIDVAPTNTIFFNIVVEP